MKRKHTVLLVLAVLLGACAMRGPFTGVGAVVGQIQADLGLNNVVAGLITTIPLVAFGAFAPFTSRFSEKLGAGRVMAGGLALAGIGVVLRSFAGVVGFFVGTALIGTGIAFVNVLLPSIIKACFPQKIGLMTAAYTASLNIVAGLAIALSLPLALLPGMGWRGSLFVWIVFIIPGVVLWLFQWRLRTSSSAAGGGMKRMLRSRKAWSVTAFMGLQSLLFYSFVAWLPTILQAKGFGAEMAGYLSSAYVWIGIPLAFVAPILAAKKQDQRPVIGVITGIYFAGMLMILSGSMPLVMAGVLIAGATAGSCLPLALCLISMRSPDAAGTARLSGMAQCVGYLVAAVSPTLLGGLFDLTASWNTAVLFLAAAVAALFIAGQAAGKPGQV